MNLLVNIVVVLSTIALLLPHGEACIDIENYTDPDYPGKCVIAPNLILSPGERAIHPYSYCTEAICREDSHAELVGCALPGAPDGYRLGNLKYPNAKPPKCCEYELIPLIPHTPRPRFGRTEFNW